MRVKSSRTKDIVKSPRIALGKAPGKYIGETEKNLGRILAGAKDGDAGLLFDEADAIFGKRTAVKDTHDRYANQESTRPLKPKRRRKKS